MTTKNRTKISPINFLYIGIVGLWLEFENVKILNTASIWPQIWKGRPKLCQKKISFGDYMIDDVTGWPPIWPSMFLCEWNKNTFHDKQKQTKISALNLMYKCIIGLWLHLYKFVFMTLLITSSGPKNNPNFELSYLRWYVSYSIDQILKISEMVMVILLAYSTSGITYGEKVSYDFKMATILKMPK